jgi:hypothetical protein
MKVGEGGRNEGVKGIPSLVPGVYKRLGGAFSGFGADGQESFWKQTPKKGVFFIQSMVLRLFLG